jgi:hypothetical protein
VFENHPLQTRQPSWPCRPVVSAQSEMESQLKRKRSCSFRFERRQAERRSPRISQNRNARKLASHSSNFKAGNDRPNRLDRRSIQPPPNQGHAIQSCRRDRSGHSATTTQHIPVLPVDGNSRAAANRLRNRTTHTRRSDDLRFLPTLSFSLCGIPRPEKLSMTDQSGVMRYWGRGVSVCPNSPSLQFPCSDLVPEARLQKSVGTHSSEASPQTNAACG